MIQIRGALRLALSKQQKNKRKVSTALKERERERERERLWTTEIVSPFTQKLTQEEEETRSCDGLKMN